MTSSTVTFLHLSDIHFRYSISKGPYDLEVVIRNELLLDAESIAKRLGGVASIFVSGDITLGGRRDENDNFKEERLKLFLSSFQTNFLRAPGIIHMTLCHHPLEWLRDHYEVEEWLDVHSRLQLFGHRHTQRVKQVADNIRVAAGAMHP